MVVGGTFTRFCRLVGVFNQGIYFIAKKIISYEISGSLCRRYIHKDHLSRGIIHIQVRSVDPDRGCVCQRG